MNIILTNNHLGNHKQHHCFNSSSYTKNLHKVALAPTAQRDGHSDIFELGTSCYDYKKGLLNLQGTPNRRIASISTVAHQKENQSQGFISVNSAIEKIKEYKDTLHIIDLSHNAIDIPTARKILEVARECPHIEQLILKDNTLIACPSITRFFDYDLSLLLKKPSVKEVNIQDNALATQTRWRYAFRNNYGKYADAKLVTQEGEKVEKTSYDEGSLGQLWLYFFA